MRLPVPTTREVHGAFYVAAICAFALTAAAVWGIVHKVSQSDSILHVAVASADQVQRLNEQLDAQGKQLEELKSQAAVDAKIAARERQSLRRQNRALLAYLRARGIEIPKTLAPRKEGSTGGGDSGPKASTPSGSSSPAPPATPGHTATPRPSTGPTASPAPGPACDLMPILCPL